MLQETARRLNGLEVSAPVVVCNDAHRFLVAEQLRVIGMPARSILLEPQGRNTAPAIALAAHAALAADEGDPLLLVLPADHVIRDPEAFQQAVIAALPAARDGALVTFGVVPSGPETGYGYIQRGSAQGAGFRIASFVEKPVREKAEQFVLGGDYYWNSGMFLFRRVAISRSWKSMPPTSPRCVARPRPAPARIWILHASMAACSPAAAANPLTTL